LDVNNEYFGPRKSGLWKGRRPWELYAEAALPREWHPILQERAVANGLVFFSSPFDADAVDFLEELAVPLYKIASLEITDISLIRKVLDTGKPVIISTGAASEFDIELVLAEARAAGNQNIYLLKCTAEYPATAQMANLATIIDMPRRFGVPAGLSDHTLGHAVAVAAVALGAVVVEKHFTLDRKLGGPDAAFSMEPDEFSEMVRHIRQASAAIGEVSYDLSDSARDRRRSLFVARDMQAGDEFTLESVRSVRPGYGLPPRFLPSVLGAKALSALSAGEPLRFEHFKGLSTD
jgi:pseudaminic acid synthase